ncbi:MAG: hypothetical protein EBQ94_11340, partial [Flavobacteriales bacterium]|nr:hypothetical protein [Flavobacteriales bacterium]
PYVWNGLTFNAAGSQTATLTSIAGCDSLETLNLSVTPTATSTTNQTICQTALPYLWNGLTFNAASSQTATLTSSAGCDSLATLNLTVTPTATSSTNQTICQTALPYTWNGLTFNAAGSQTATLTSVAGCDSLATLNLTVTSTATSVTNQTVCQSALPYVWNGLTFNAAGSQTATLKFAGCDSLATLNLTIINNPILSISSLTICSGETTTLNSTVSQQGGSYNWSTGATSNSIIISPTTTTNYTLTYTLTGCNPINTSATITVNPAPIISVQSATICSGQNNTLTTIVNQSGGTYSWSTGATTASISVSPTITTNYSVSYTLGNCSIASASATVTVNPTPSITSNPQTICSGNTANITTTSSPLGGTYIWGNGQTTSTINVTPTSTTTYQVTYSLNGCSNNISTIVTVNPTPTVVITNQTICSGQSVTLTSATSPTGGTYLWSNGATTSSLVVNPLTTTNFNLLYSLNGCTANSTVIVTVNPIPTLTVANSTICSGESETLSATPNLTGGTYLWSPGGQTTATINVNPTQTTTYNVVYSLNNCSSSPSNITLTVNPMPSVNVTSSTICNGATATLNATTSIAGGTWNWLSNGQQTASISVSPNQTTNYVVEYTVNG